MLKAPMKFMSGNEIRTSQNATPLDGQALPTREDGVNPKYVAVCHDGDSAAGLLIRIAFGGSTIAVTTTTGFAIPQHELLVFDVAGFSHYAIVGNLAGPVDFTISPLEND